MIKSDIFRVIGMSTSTERGMLSRKDTKLAILVLTVAFTLVCNSTLLDQIQKTLINSSPDASASARIPILEDTIPVEENGAAATVKKVDRLGCMANRGGVNPAPSRDQYVYQLARPSTIGTCKSKEFRSSFTTRLRSPTKLCRRMIGASKGTTAPTPSP